MCVGSTGENGMGQMPWHTPIIELLDMLGLYFRSTLAYLCASNERLKNNERHVLWLRISKDSCDVLWRLHSYHGWRVLTWPIWIGCWSNDGCLRVQIIYCSLPYFFNLSGSWVLPHKCYTYKDYSSYAT